MAGVGNLVAVFATVLLCAVVGSVQGQSTDTLATDVAAKLMAEGFSNVLNEIDVAELFSEVTTFVARGGKVTAFLPRDNYFPSHVDTGLLTYLQGNKVALREVLKFHLVPNYLLKSDKKKVDPPFTPFTDGAVYPTFNDRASVKITFKGNMRLVEMSPIKFADYIVLNESLVVHGINGFLLPPYAVPNIPVSNKTCASKGTCSPGPSSPSVAPAPAPVESAMPPATAPAPGPSAENIIIAALNAAGYTSLVQLILSSDLLVTYTEQLLPGPVTFLAPDNEALRPVLTPNFTNTANSNPAVVQAVLDLHIIPGLYVTYSSIVDTQDLNYKNKAGSTLYFKYTPATTTATVGLTPAAADSSAKIFSNPILANGRISVLGIDKVLRPPTGGAPPPASTGVRLEQGFLSIAIAFLSLFMV